MVEIHLKAPTDTSFTFNWLTDKEIPEYIDNTLPKNSCGYDKLSSKMLIQLAPIIHLVIRLISNQSLLTGIFTRQLKSCSNTHLQIRMILATKDIYLSYQY